MARVEIEKQISFFSFGFARVSEVRHISLIFAIPFLKMQTSSVNTITCCHRTHF